MEDQLRRICERNYDKGDVSLPLQDVRVRGPGPELGVHTAAVLKERLSMSDAQVAELTASGTIGAKPVPGSPYANWAARL